MMFVLALRLHIEIYHSIVGKTLEKVKEHFGRHVAYFFAVKISIPHRPRTTGTVQRNLPQAIVHGKTESVSLYSPLVSQSLTKAKSQNYCRVLNGVMLINIKVSLYFYVKVNVSMFCYLLQHVVEKADSRGYVAVTYTVEIERNKHVCLVSGSSFLHTPCTGYYNLGNFTPRHIF